MPSRPACLAILVAWTLATFGLVRRDLLPELLLSPPPDLRSTARTGQAESSTRWAIQVLDAKEPGSVRSVGRAVTNSKVRPDEWIELSSLVTFDSSDLLKGTPFASNDHLRLEIRNSCLIDPSGNPKLLKADVLEAGGDRPLMSVTGEFRDRSLFLKSTGPVPALNRIVTIPYEPRTMVQNAFSPTDRLPGLQVGQRWESKIVSPLTGRAEVVRVEVERQAEIFWDRGLVKTFVVVQRMPPLSARTWVRTDGVVLRQEVPLPFVKLLLERQP